MAMAVKAGLNRRIAKTRDVLPGMVLPLGLFFSMSVKAETWQYTPDIRVALTKTDNVKMAPKGKEAGDIALEVVPGINYSRKDGRVDINVNYSLDHVVHFENDGGNRNVHALSSSAKLEPIDRLFFIDGTAQISQQNISALSVQSTSNINTNPNRANVFNFSLSPYYKTVIGQGNEFELRYRINDTYTDSELLNSGSISRAVIASLRGRGLQSSWAISAQRYESAATGDVRTKSVSGKNVTVNESIQGSGSWFSDPQLVFNGNVGYEHLANYTTGVPFALTYGWGIGWRPNNLTEVNFSVGRKATGQNYNFGLSHKTAWTAWNVSWSRDVTSTQTQLSASNPTFDLFSSLVSKLYSDPKAQEQVLSALGVPKGYIPTLGLFSNQMMRQNLFRGSLAIVGVRNTISFNLVRTTSSSASGVGSNDDLSRYSSLRQNSWGAVWNLKVSQNTNFSVSYNRSRNEGVTLTGTSGTRQSNFESAISTQLSPKLNAALMLRGSNNDGQIGGTVRENAVVSTLAYKF